MGAIVGIDLGTTNSCVAVVKDGRPRVIEDEHHPLSKIIGDALVAPFSAKDEGIDGTPTERAATAATAGHEVMWPYEHLPAPPRWHRAPWQQPWVEVTAKVDGQRCLLGRGPRSAAGPDLRTWLADRDGAEATVGAVPRGERWMGRATVDEPWAVALSLLRSDLRPAVLDVVDGELLVGFRGPAADAYGVIASRRVPGGLTPTPYRARPLPSGPLCYCSAADPDAVAVTPIGVLKRDV